MFTAIAAMTDSRGIGFQGTLPWHLAEDLTRFRILTTGRTLIMGRKTWDSLPRPLIGRTVLVLSPSGNRVASADTDYALSEIPDAELLGLYQNLDGAMVVGGREIYALMLRSCARMELTIIHAEYEVDTYFPEWPHKLWTVDRADRQECRCLKTDRIVPVTFMTLLRVWDK